MELDELFGLAVEKPAGPEREQFLNEHCQGNPALRQEVESLLRSHEAAGSFFLNRPVVQPESVATDKFAQKWLGKMIGPYRLLQLIGYGGMGVVYAAEQKEPVRRKVAVKLIRTEFASRNIVARFEAERQALAIMDHPSIARVIDGGLTELGQPWFVMELVKGIPITEYCDRARLTPRQRLELMIPVCQAVQHAHQKGIIHRDLKPSNVLVTEYDGRPVPKIIDFGVAKAVDFKLTDHTVHTDFGMVVGTLEYMSPEQAGLNQLDIDTRSDVYSLGVLIYELLTGSTPINRSQLASAAILEALRLICEVEPERPSTRISSTEQVASVAANRAMEPTHLTGLFRGELDWISMRAIEKDRLRRYQSASELADDLQRYLNNEPIKAGPPTWRYQASKFVRRNQLLVTAVTFVLVAILAGIVGTSIAWMQATYQRARAEDERDLKIEALDKLSSEQNRTRQALIAETAAKRNALRALRTLTDQVVERQLARKVALDSQDRSFFARIIADYQTLAATQGLDVESIAMQAEGHLRVGMLRYSLGETLPALSDIERTIQLLGQLQPDAAAQQNWDMLRSTAYQYQGRIRAQLGQRDGATESFNHCIRVAEDALKSQDSFSSELENALVSAYSSRGGLLGEMEVLDQAESDFRRAIALLEKQTSDATAKTIGIAQQYVNLGVLRRKENNLAGAAENYLQAIKLLTDLGRDAPEHLERRESLAQVHNNLGNLYYQHGKMELAEEQSQAALAIRRKLVADFPAIPEFQDELVTSLTSLSGFLQKLGKKSEAQTVIVEATSVCERLVNLFPHRVSYKINLGGIYCNSGLFHRDQGETRTAIGWFDRAVDILSPVVKENPQLTDAKKFLFNSLYSRARSRMMLNEFESAVADWDRVLELDPQSNVSKIRRATCLAYFDVPRAIEETHEISQLVNTEFDVARILAICVLHSDDSAQHDTLVNRMVELLQRSLDNESILPEQLSKSLKSDRAFDGVRELEPFVRLMQSLER